MTCHFNSSKKCLLCFLTLSFMTLLSSCSESKTTMSKITIIFPQSSDLAKNDHSSSQGYLAKANPATISSFNCYGVLVSYENSNNSCQGLNGELLLTPNLRAGMFSSGSSVVLSIPRGYGRKISIIASENDTANCPSLDIMTLAQRVHMSKIKLIGEVTADLLKAEETVEITTDPESVITVDFCQGPLFTWDPLPEQKDPSTNFTGILAVSDITDSTALLSWDNDPQAVAYDIFQVEAVGAGSSSVTENLVLLATAGGGMHSYLLSGLAVAHDYTLRVLARFADGSYDSNTVNFAITTAAFPQAPNNLTIVTPVLPNVPQNPITILVEGVKIGDVIRVYGDTNCSVNNYLAEATAMADNLSINVSFPSSGSYQIHATATGSSGTTSPCSVAGIYYDFNLSSFAGLNNIINITDSTAELQWISHSSAIGYQVLRKIGSNVTNFFYVNGGSSMSVVLTNLTPGENYEFLVRMEWPNHTFDNNSNFMSAQMALTPTIPTGIELVNPYGQIAGFNNFPVLKVLGTKSGDTIRIFADSICSVQIGEQIAPNNSNETQITLNSLVPANYQFYARAIGSGGNPSPCSIAFAPYLLMVPFAGVSNYTDLTDSSVVLHWALHPNAAHYLIYEVVGGNLTYLTSSVDGVSTEIKLEGLIPNHNYVFRVRVQDSYSSSDNNTNDLPLTTNIAPNAPSILTLVHPVGGSGLSAHPIIQVEGVKSGDIIKLFTDSICSEGHKVAEVNATGVVMQLSPISPLAAGSYNFYASATNSLSQASACSSSFVTYAKLACPIGYIPVPPNPALYTFAPFCVAKYEMKNNASVATSQAAGFPWTNLTQDEARSHCFALGANYQLISNAQWMTVAHNAEQGSLNWSSGTPATGVFPRGHCDSGPSSTLEASSNDGDHYYLTNNFLGQGPLSGEEQRRVLILSNGEKIWDMAGNVSEWVDWNIDPAMKAYLSIDGTTSALWKEINIIDANISLGQYMEPAAWLPFYHPSINSSNGIGKYWAGYNNSGGAAQRGGNFSSGGSAGIYALQLQNSASNYSGSELGFRCSFVP